MAEVLLKHVTLHLNYLNGLTENVNNPTPLIKSVFSPVLQPLKGLGQDYFYHALSAVPISD